MSQHQVIPNNPEERLSALEKETRDAQQQKAGLGLATKIIFAALGLLQTIGIAIWLRMDTRIERIDDRLRDFTTIQAEQRFSLGERVTRIETALGITQVAKKP